MTQLGFNQNTVSESKHDLNNFMNNVKCREKIKQFSNQINVGIERSDVVSNNGNGTPVVVDHLAWIPNNLNYLVQGVDVSLDDYHLKGINTSFNFNLNPCSIFRIINPTTSKIIISNINGSNHRIELNNSVDNCGLTVDYYDDKNVIIKRDIINISNKVKLDKNYTCNYNLYDYAISISLVDQKLMCRIYYVVFDQTPTVQTHDYYIENATYWHYINTSSRLTYLSPQLNMDYATKFLSRVIINCAIVSYYKYHNKQMTSDVNKMSNALKNDLNYVRAMSKVGMSALLNANILSDRTVGIKSRTYKSTTTNTFTISFPKTLGYFGDGIVPRIPTITQWFDMWCIMAHKNDSYIGLEERYLTYDVLRPRIQFTTSGYGNLPIDQYELLGHVPEQNFVVSVDDGTDAKITSGELFFTALASKVEWGNRLTTQYYTNDVWCFGRGMSCSDVSPFTVTTALHGFMAPDKSSSSYFGVFGDISYDLTMHLKIHANDIIPASSGHPIATLKLNIDGVDKTFTLPMKLTQDMSNTTVSVYYKSEDIKLIPKCTAKILFQTGEQVPIYKKGKLNDGQDYYGFSETHNNWSMEGLERIMYDHDGNTKRTQDNVIDAFINVKRDNIVLADTGKFLSNKSGYEWPINWAQTSVSGGPIWDEGRINFPDECIAVNRVQATEYGIAQAIPNNHFINGGIYRKVKCDNPSYNVNVFNAGKFKILYPKEYTIKIVSMQTDVVKELVYPSGFSNNVDTIGVLGSATQLTEFTLQSIMYMSQWLSNVTKRLNEVNRTVNSLIMNVNRNLENEHSLLGGISSVATLIGEWLSIANPVVGLSVILVGLSLSALNHVISDNYESAGVDIITMIIMVCMTKRSVAKTLINKLSRVEVPLSSPTTFVKNAAKRMGISRTSNSFEYIELSEMGSKVSLRDRMWALSRNANPEAFDTAFNAGFHVELMTRVKSKSLTELSRTKRTAASVPISDISSKVTRDQTVTYGFHAHFYYYFELAYMNNVFLFEFTYEYIVNSDNDQREFNFVEINAITSSQSDFVWRTTTIESFIQCYGATCPIKDEEAFMANLHSIYFLVSLNGLNNIPLDIDHVYNRTLLSGIMQMSKLQPKVLSPLIALDNFNSFPKLRNDTVQKDLYVNVLYHGINYIPHEWTE
nr:B spike protein [Fijivirus sp.]